MTRAARLEWGVQVTLKRIGFSELRGELVSRRDAVSVAATLPQMRGQKGVIRGGA